tara:strand:- start:5 stop:481 length:477 start_codon:yes stop_codon:yes gene_type:complete
MEVLIALCCLCKNIPFGNYVCCLLFFLPFIGGCGEDHKTSKIEPSYSTSSISSNGQMRIDKGAFDVSSLCVSKIENSLKKKTDSAKGCYQRQLKANPSLKGRVKLTFRIQENGSVDEVIISNGTQDNRLSHCIKKRVMEWVFPKNCSTSLDFSFIFTP